MFKEPFFSFSLLWVKPLLFFYTWMFKEPILFLPLALVKPFSFSSKPIHPPPPSPSPCPLCYWVIHFKSWNFATMWPIASIWLQAFALAFIYLYYLLVIVILRFMLLYVNGCVFNPLGNYDGIYPLLPWSQLQTKLH
jgi:hypothetical protein